MPMDMMRTLGPDDFLGRWSLRRDIDDRHSGQTGHLAGEATFEADASGGLTYVEGGMLRMGALPALSASRRYLWRFADGRVEVRFADGAAFHSFAPVGHARGTDHPCGADHYRVRYDFSTFPDWSARWEVTGPKKDYTSVSRYTRQPQ